MSGASPESVQSPNPALSSLKSCLGLILMPKTANVRYTKNKLETSVTGNVHAVISAAVLNLADKRGVRMSDIVRDAINQYVDRTLAVKALEESLEDVNNE